MNLARGSLSSVVILEARRITRVRLGSLMAAGFRRSPVVGLPHMNAVVGSSKSQGAPYAGPVANALNAEATIRILPLMGEQRSRKSQDDGDHGW